MADKDASADKGALANLFGSLRDVPRNGLPPVEQWRPKRNGLIDIVIKADGSWWHEGGEITRLELCRLFASILVCENQDQFYLVTPLEKLRISVVDAPLLIVESVTENIAGQESIVVRTNLDDAVRIDSVHRLILRDDIPYVYLRRGLWAKVSRNVYYQWVEETLQSATQAEGELILHSAGERYAIGRTAD